MCIGLSSNTHECNKCNIINNYQNSNNYGTILNSGPTTTISECCFKGNNNYNDNNKGKLFYVYSGTLTISNSNIDILTYGTSNNAAIFNTENNYKDIFYQGDLFDCMFIISNHRETPNLKCKCTINIQMISISLLLNHFLIEDE
jgi:hypothetical protein